MSDPQRAPNIVELASYLPPGTGLIYRHFGADNRFHIAEELKDISRANKLVFLVSHDTDLERYIQPDGVHFPKRMLTSIKRHAPNGRLQTVSVHSRRQAAKAITAGADACLISSIYPSKSPSAPRAMGLHRFRLLSASLDKPLYALGGINHENAGQIVRVGGFACVSAASIFKK